MALEKNDSAQKKHQTIEDKPKGKNGT